MKRSAWRWFAISSVMLAAVWASSETRAQYGGVLRVEMRDAPASLDPAQGDSFGRRELTMLIFDTLVKMDDGGHVQPWLAGSWQTSSGGERWQFHIRRGVKFHDGTPLTAEAAAASLRTANPTWKVSVEGESLVIEWDRVNPDLLAELALPRNAIAKRTADNPSGTGPFQIANWEAGKKLTLAADENCWSGRPFLDGIEIEMGKSLRDQMTALELNRADLVDAAPEQAHRAAQQGRRVVSSAPLELLALVFSRSATSPQDKLLREALSWSVERASIGSVLLQGAGQAAGGILPNWISGYEFVFPTDADLPRARQARQQMRNVATWTLGYDANDPLVRLIAERIALNARDAGLALQPTTAASADVRLARIPLASRDGALALTDLAATLGLPPEAHDDKAEDLYAAEVALLSTQAIIPLFHVPAAYAATTNLHGWRVEGNGSWDLSDAWLSGR